MEPMKPMKPMEGMRPMEPMKPMKGSEPWWPRDLGEPSTSGGQNDVQYAFFAAAHRLLIRKGGEIATYDSGDHGISGVSQQQSGSSSLTFTSGEGRVDLDALKKV
ncbi:hypothetical protein SAMN05216548_10931 [Faunimonas pinastri]|uniref:Uncharacterized protein n=1 Tax=Faunimonas pinastri TaxID=1855383 RepID=A0A1H9K089_9HYPH|nr:hypothetical protein [Faunimonas pinastri]SEQ92437.1 hypothetical protein SAMN05216548_10931 [Faunimonas pinastri]